jgi:hypothetical protein
VPYEPAEEPGIFEQLAQLNLYQSKALLKRGELLKELVLGELLLLWDIIVFVVSADDTFHDHTPLSPVELGRVSSGWPPPWRQHRHTVSVIAISVTKAIGQISLFENDADADVGHGG